VKQDVFTASERVRTFIDLRSFAATAAVSGGDYLSARTPLALPDGPVAIAALTATGNGSIERLDADEFLIVLEGELSLDSGTTNVRLKPGESVVLPANLSFTWSAGPNLRAIVMRCAVIPGATDIVPIDDTAPLTPSGSPQDALLIGPTPSCRNHRDYQSEDDVFICGTWDSTPYHRRAMSYGHYELMHLLAGEVTVEDETGRTGTFGQGDTFVVELGAFCSWSSKTHVKKAYAIYRPA
jgi:uncharacterized cupin superfamily protein